LPEIYYDAGGRLKGHGRQLRLLSGRLRGWGGAAEEVGDDKGAVLVSIRVAEVRSTTTVGGGEFDCWVGFNGGGEADWEVPVASTSIGVDLSLGVADVVKLDQAGAQGGPEDAFFWLSMVLRTLDLLEVWPGVPLAGSFFSIELEQLTTMVNRQMRTWLHT